MLKQNPQQIRSFAERLARQMPFTVEQVERGLSELVEYDVIQIDGCKLGQKRMIRDGAISEKRSRAGQKGGFATAKTKANNNQNPVVVSAVEDANASGIEDKSPVVYSEQGVLDHPDLQGFDRPVRLEAYTAYKQKLEQEKINAPDKWLRVVCTNIQKKRPPVVTDEDYEATKRRAREAEEKARERQSRDIEIPPTAQEFFDRGRRKQA